MFVSNRRWDYFEILRGLKLPTSTMLDSTFGSQKLPSKLADSFVIGFMKVHYAAT
jgi:hypothetical protein